MRTETNWSLDLENITWKVSLWNNSVTHTHTHINAFIRIAWGERERLFFFLCSITKFISKSHAIAFMVSFTVQMCLFFPDKFAAVCYFKSHRNTDFICWYMLKFRIDSVTRIIKSKKNACNEKKIEEIFFCDFKWKEYVRLKLPIKRANKSTKMVLFSEILMENNEHLWRIFFLS